MPDVVALDVALLPPPWLHERLLTVNAGLTPPPDGFHFDATHLPHLTLAQHFVARDAIGSVTGAVDQLLSRQRPLELTTTRVSVGRVASTLGVHPTAALQSLHQRLMDVLAPFELTEGGPPAFDTDDLPARTADVTWVREFRHHAAYERFEPHITLGVGTVNETFPPAPFRATEVALCRLGRFCTCRRPLAWWTLTASDR